MADFDPYSALTLDEPTAAEMARARAAALRGQNFAGLVGSLAHDPYAARSGGALMQQAQQGMTQLGELPGERMRQALQQQQVAKGQQEAAGNASPEYGSAARILLQRFGVPMPETAPNTALRAVLPVAEKAYEADEQRKLREQLARMPSLGVNTNTGQLYNKHGQISAPSPAVPPAADGIPGASPAPAPPPLAGKLLDKALKELQTDMDASTGRSGEFGKNQARINAANRLLALATDEHGQPKDLNPQQMPELSQALASLISGGGAGAQSQIEHLTPKTLRGDLQRTLQWLTGNPRGADQVAFVQNMIETAKREKDVAGQAIDSARGSRFGRHTVIRSNPEDARRVLTRYGWDLGPDGMPVMKAAPGAAAGGGGAADLRKKYGL